MEERSTEVFEETGTIGIEEEFFVVDDAGRPTSGTDELVYETEPPEILEGRLVCTECGAEYELPPGTTNECPDCGFVDTEANWTSYMNGDQIVYVHECPSCGSERDHSFHPNR
jgi:rRNA maturation endonuclease Nob1